jgi:hypothetical protein
MIIHSRYKKEQFTNLKKKKLKKKKPRNLKSRNAEKMEAPKTEVSGTKKVKGSNSNGHGKEMDKEGHIMKILEGLQREAKKRQADSRKLMKVKDRQGKLNLKFLQSLERIEKKLEKGRDSRYDRESQRPWEKN